MKSRTPDLLIAVVSVAESMWVSVYAPDGLPVPQLPRRVSASSIHNRRRSMLGGAAALSEGTPVPGPGLAPTPGPASGPAAAMAAASERHALAAAQAGVAAMESPLSGAAVERMCAAHSWPLALDPGQNRLSIQVTAPEAQQGFAAGLVSLAARAPGTFVAQNSTAARLAPAQAAAPAAVEPWRDLADERNASTGLALNGSQQAGQGVWAGGDSETYWLSVVRLADPEHAQMAELNATTASHGSFRVCWDGGRAGASGSSSSATGTAGWGEAAAEAGGGGGALPECVPNERMWLNVSHSVDWVSLHPGLRWPGVPGLRVEVNGQVLCMSSCQVVCLCAAGEGSRGRACHVLMKGPGLFWDCTGTVGQSTCFYCSFCAHVSAAELLGAQVLSAGGDVGADQMADTMAVTRARAQADFLPIALVLGLNPGALLGPWLAICLSPPCAPAFFGRGTPRMAGEQ